MKKIINICLIAALSITCLSAQALWQCNFRNAKNQLWVGTGPTALVAKTNARDFCRSNSNNPATCTFMRCFTR